MCLNKGDAYFAHVPLEHVNPLQSCKYDKKKYMKYFLIGTLMSLIILGIPFTCFLLFLPVILFGVVFCILVAVIFSKLWIIGLATVIFLFFKTKKGQEFGHQLTTKCRANFFEKFHGCFKWSIQIYDIGLSLKIEDLSEKSIGGGEQIIQNDDNQPKISDYFSTSSPVIEKNKNQSILTDVDNQLHKSNIYPRFDVAESENNIPDDFEMITNRPSCPVESEYVL
uniref:Uncharacterized protein n=1 Tax=Panagrolaimus sp. PS1159 TaxID=55785 RepID=A0AC35G0F6_9BILA